MYQRRVPSKAIATPRPSGNCAATKAATSLEARPANSSNSTAYPWRNRGKPRRHGFGSHESPTAALRFMIQTQSQQGAQRECLIDAVRTILLLADPQQIARNVC